MAQASRNVRDFSYGGRELIDLEQSYERT